MRYALRLASMLSLLLIIVLVLIVGVPRLIYGEPKGDWLTWQSDSTCELPCWRGIVPGKTTLGEAHLILQHFPDIVSNDDSHTNRIAPFRADFFYVRTRTTKNQIVLQSFTGSFDSLDDTIRQISLVYLLDFPQAIERLGKPDQMAILTNNSTITIYLSFKRNLVFTYYFFSTFAGNSTNFCKTGIESLKINLITLRNHDDPTQYQPWTGYDSLKKTLCDTTQ